MNQGNYINASSHLFDSEVVRDTPYEKCQGWCNTLFDVRDLKWVKDGKGELFCCPDCIETLNEKQINN